MSFAPDGQTLAVGVGNTVRLRATRPKAPVAEFHHPGQVLSIAFSPDGKFVAVEGSNATVLVWDRDTGRQAARMPGKWVEFSPDGKLLAAGLDNTVRLHEVATWQELAAFGGPKFLDGSRGRLGLLTDTRQKGFYQSPDKASLTEMPPTETGRLLFLIRVKALTADRPILFASGRVSHVDQARGNKQFMFGAIELDTSSR